MWHPEGQCLPTFGLEFLTGSQNFLKNGAIATLTQPFKQGKPRCRTPPQVQSNASSSELAMRVLAASCCILYPGCPGPHLCNGFSTIPALDHQWSQWFRPIQTDSVWFRCNFSLLKPQLITADHSWSQLIWGTTGHGRGHHLRGQLLASESAWGLRMAMADLLVSDPWSF